jgi:RNA polymerase sigma factor (sigma-70 family)
VFLDPEAAPARDTDAATSPHRAYAQSELREAVTTAIRSLPENYGAVAWLRFADEMKVADIAQALGLSRAATESRLRRAAAMLRESLSDLCPELTHGESNDEVPLDPQADIRAIGRRA